MLAHQFVLHVGLPVRDEKVLSAEGINRFPPWLPLQDDRLPALTLLASSPYWINSVRPEKPWTSGLLAANRADQRQEGDRAESWLGYRSFSMRR